MFRLRGILTLLVLALAACGGGRGDTISPKTVEEYAAAVCDPVDLPDDATWKQARAKLERDIERAGNVMPPEVVRDWNFTALASMKKALRVMDSMDLDSDDLLNPYELAPNEDLMLLFTLHQEAENALDAETKDILLNHGCLD